MTTRDIGEDEYRQWLTRQLDTLAAELTEKARAEWGLPEDMHFEWGEPE
jgi:hypothetical protein